MLRVRIPAAEIKGRGSRVSHLPGLGAFDANELIVGRGNGWRNNKWQHCDASKDVAAALHGTR